MRPKLPEIVRDIGVAETRTLRAPRPRDGEIRLKWGKLRDDSPDLIVAGRKVPAADRSLVMHAFTSQRFSVWDGWDPSLAEELHNRGYDLRTLRFSIRKRGT